MIQIAAPLSPALANLPARPMPAGGDVFALLLAGMPAEAGAASAGVDAPLALAGASGKTAPVAAAAGGNPLPTLSAPAASFHAAADAMAIDPPAPAEVAGEAAAPPAPLPGAGLVGVAGTVSRAAADPAAPQPPADRAASALPAAKCRVDIPTAGKRGAARPSDPEAAVAADTSPADETVSTDMPPSDDPAASLGGCLVDLEPIALPTGLPITALPAVAPQQTTAQPAIAYESAAKLGVRRVDLAPVVLPTALPIAVPPTIAPDPTPTQLALADGSAPVVSVPTPAGVLPPVAAEAKPLPAIAAPLAGLAPSPTSASAPAQEVPTASTIPVAPSANPSPPSASLPPAAAAAAAPTVVATAIGAAPARPIADAVPVAPAATDARPSLRITQPAQPVVGTTAPAAWLFAAAIGAADRQDRSATPAAMTIATGIEGPAIERHGDTAPADALARLLAPAAADPIAPAANQPTIDLADHRWPAAMVDHIERLRDAADATSTRIRVVPDALGSIDVTLKRHDDGAVQVRLDADRPATRALLADTAPELARLAETRGLRLVDATSSADTGGSFGSGFAGDGAWRGQGGQRQPAAPPRAPAAAPAPSFTDEAEAAEGRIA